MNALLLKPVASELHQQLPWWTGYASLLTMTMLWFFAALLLGGIGALIAGVPLMGAKDEPWYERARKAYSLRVLLMMQSFVWPLVALILCSVWPLPFGFRSLAIRCFVPAVVVLAVLWLLRYIGEKRILGQKSIIGLLRNTVIYHFAFGQVSVVIAVIAVIIMPASMRWSVFGVVALTAAAILFFSLGGSLLVLRMLRLLVPASERLSQIVSDAATEVAANAPVTYIARMPSANAMAFPWNGRLAFSEGILESLDDEQLYSVAAHEICHLGMPTSQKVIRVLSGLSVLVPLTLIKPFYGQFGASALLPMLLGILVLVIVIQIFGRILMRREEERADRAGAAANEAVYALALERIYEQNLIPANIRSPQGHPPLYDRMVASGVTPSYPKPKRPPGWLRHVAFIVQLLTFMMLALFLVVAYAVTQAFVPATKSAQLALLSFAGGRSCDVARLGELYIESGEEELGLRMLEYAEDQASGDIEVLARLAKAYAQRGRCEEALQLFNQASSHQQDALRREQEAFAEAQEAVADCD